MKAKTVELLNTLITINNDRIEGYTIALKATEELDLSNLFSRFISTSEICQQELLNEVKALDGEVSNRTIMTASKFFSSWIDVKAAIKVKDLKAILNTCEYGEAKVLDAYDKVLKNKLDYLSEGQQRMIISHISSLKFDHKNVKTLHDAFIEA
jgi:uncharacterized protein (TIGR02284 family)